MAKLIDMMRQAGVQWSEGAEYAAQDGDDGLVFFFSEEPTRREGVRVWEGFGCVQMGSTLQLDVAEDWGTPVTRYEWFDCLHQSAIYRDPDYMREQPRLAARSQERRDLVRELMLRHPELTGPQAIEQADEILETLEGLKWTQCWPH